MALKKDTRTLLQVWQEVCALIEDRSPAFWLKTKSTEKWKMIERRFWKRS